MVMMAGGLMITKGGRALMLVDELKALEDGSHGSIYLYLLIVLPLLLSFNKKWGEASVGEQDLVFQQAIYETSYLRCSGVILAIVE